MGRLLQMLVVLLVQPALALQSQATTHVSPLPSSLHSNTTIPQSVPQVNTTKRRKRSKRKHATARILQAVENKENRSAEAAATTTQSIENKENHSAITKSTRRKETGGQEAACLRRIKREWRDAVKLGIAYDWKQMKTLGSASSDKYAYVRIGPLGKNLLEWHFSVMGPPSSEYQGGIYHGRVLLPKNYPASPPRIQVLTPSGRFIPGHDICLSASSYHPESWTPRWTVLSLVEALRLHMITTANEIGGKDDTPKKRRQYARASRKWHHGHINHSLMVNQGIFPWQDEAPESLKTANKNVDGDGGVQVAVKRTQEAIVRKRVPHSTRLPAILFRAVIEVLTSPVRLSLLFLMTVFIILNRR